MIPPAVQGSVADEVCVGSGNYTLQAVFGWNASDATFTKVVVAVSSAIRTVARIGFAEDQVFSGESETSSH